MTTPTRAVVFAHHNVGTRCLKVLFAHGIEVALVVTHEPDPSEAPWFASVSAVADDGGLDWIAPTDPNTPELVTRIASLKPDFLFSFYYRKMLGPPLLQIPKRGALNMHGSLLPRYRGRAPVNWAVLHGERETGASLHYMSEKPDAGDLVAQLQVPILPDDTAREVLDKVTVASELVLHGAIPSLVAGTAPRVPQDLTRGSYFGARNPADARIDWTQNALRIHNLVRSVAPPYPGAMTTIGGRPARVLHTRLLDSAGPAQTAYVRAHGDILVAHAGGGGRLRLLVLEIEGEVTHAEAFKQRFGSGPIPFPV